jgi:hypothetical protein
MFSKSFRLELEQRKASSMDFEKWGGGEGLCLHNQEGQDLLVCAAAEELIFNTSSQHQTVHDEGFSERFSPWLHSAWRTRDHTFDMHLSVDT